MAWLHGAESSDARFDAVGHCGAQRRFARQSSEGHQLHHEGLLVMSRVLVVNPERWWSGAGQRVVVDCNDQRSGAKRSNSFPFPAHAPAERVEAKF